MAWRKTARAWAPDRRRSASREEGSTRTGSGERPRHQGDEERRHHLVLGHDRAGQGPRGEEDEGGEREAPPPASALSTAATVETEVLAFLERWRAAWEARDLEPYLALYEEGFSGDGLDLEGWRAKKRSVFAQAGTIRVTLSEVTVRATADGARVELRQGYESGTRKDRGRKTLTLRRGDRGFAIVGESFRAER